MKSGWLILAAFLALAPSHASQRRPIASLARMQAATAFVDRLYSYYRIEPSRPPDDARIWTPAMLALMARLDSLGDEARLEVSDGDEICQCQDWGEFALLSRRIVQRGPNRADAFVRIRNFGETTELRLVLERTPVGWRVADLFAPYRPGGLAAAYREALTNRPDP